jgi:predicted AlkP superfamily pyrophosphatase or phosphodiesterase
MKKAIVSLKSILVLLTALPAIASPLLAQGKAKPKLVVGIVVDQMCYEYLYRYQSKFSKQGFVKLMNSGTHCRNTQYNYVPTFTGPGHASIYTGTTPVNHGIVANDWYDRSLHKTVNCVGDSSVQTVGSSSTSGLCSPKNLKAHTITDQLKLTYPASRVIAVSIKDRSAILPGGHLSDGSYWFDYSNGNFITSTFYKTALPAWVADFNAQKQADGYLQQTWNTLNDISTYTESGPDNTPYEILMPGKTEPVFPYDLKAMSGSTPNYSLFTASPFANTFLTDFALHALASEKLGQRQETDFLCISYSTPDIVGHAFGPYSVEIEDVYLRLDLEIARLVRQLEKQVGKENLVLFVTADHAVVPVPQFLTDHQLPGGYLFLTPLIESLKTKAAAHFGADFVITEENDNVYFDRELLKSKGIDLLAAQEYVKEEIRNWTGVKRVYTAHELELTSTDLEWRDMVGRGFRYAESGDVIFLTEPGYLTKGTDTERAHRGTSHGSSFNYDTHVPLIWYGGMIPKQEIIRRVNITDITATLVHILNVQKPNATTGEPILEIFRKK